MNDRFPDAAKVAAADDADLGLGGTVPQVTAGFLALADQLDRKPAAVPGAPVRISGATLRAVTYELLLHNDTLAPLTQFWKVAADLAAGRARPPPARPCSSRCPRPPRPSPACPRTIRSA